METTGSKRRVEIRLLDRPIYFKSGFLTGSMESRVLVLNPDQDPKTAVWKCINISTMTKLPTLKWCVQTALQYRGVGSTYTGMDHKVLWSGYIREAKFDLLIAAFDKCQQYRLSQ